MDQVRPQPIRWPCDHANVDWSTYPLQTPSGGGRAPTPYRSKTPANGMTQKGIDLSRPVTEGWVEPLRDPSLAERPTAVRRKSRTRQCVATTVGYASMATRRRDGYRCAPPILRADVPGGQIPSCFPKWPVQPPFQKYFPSPLRQISSLSRIVLSRRSAYRDRHGRWERDAVDAAALGVCLMAGQADKAWGQSDGVLGERC